MENLKENSSAARARKGKIASVVGIIVNFLLAAAKIVAGTLTGLVSVAADGFNNLSDCGSSTVSLVSFRISEKPADKEHPFGHQRAEYVASMIIAFLVLFLAIELFRESIGKVLEGTVSAGGVLVYMLLALSFAVKGAMFFYYRTVGKRLNSDPLKAAAKDSACDCISTAAVLIGLIVSQFAHFSADGWAGLFVALFIAWQGIGILREASSKLLGQAPDPALVGEIEARVRKGEGVLGLHDLQVFCYGPNKYFASVHIEMDAKIPVLVSHERIDEIEWDFSQNTNVLLTAHLDPIDIDDEKAVELGKRIGEALKAVDENCSIHDFRVVWGEKLTKVIFDVTVPFECKKKNEQICSEVVHIVRGLGAYDPVVRIERG